MLAIVRQRAEAAGLQNVEPVQAGLLSYQHQGEPVDLVYSRHALHHLPDFWKAVAVHRIAAMLRPGGVFRLRDLLFSCALAEIDAVVDGWLGRASTIPGVGWQRSELAIHMRDEYSTFTWLIEPILTQAGFVIESAEYDSSQIYTAYTCRKRPKDGRASTCRNRAGGGCGCGRSSVAGIAGCDRFSRRVADWIMVVPRLGKRTREYLRWLRAGDRVAAIEDKERYPGNSELASQHHIGADLVRIGIAGQHLLRCRWDQDRFHRRVCGAFRVAQCFALR